MARGAHHGEDFRFVEKNLVPPLELGLKQGRSRLNAQAVLGGGTTKVESWQSDFDRSDVWR